MITIPFEVEKAKKIHAGELPGKIVTRSGINVRVLCWDRKTEFRYHIVALLNYDEYEDIAIYSENGESNKVGSSCDLMLQVPEWTQYKDGDILACETHNGPNDYYKWFSILKGEVGLMVDNIGFRSYVLYHYDSSYNEGELTYAEYADNIDTIRLATEEEKQKFIKRLQEEHTDKVKDILKRFFGMEEKQECEFEPFQKVLVRLGDDCTWEASLFSHLCDKEDEPFCTVGGIEYEQCIPYNDQTKHLLGTTENWEEQQ